MTKYSQYLEFAIDIAKKAGEIQLSYFGKISSLQTKSSNIDLVTNADIESEHFILEQISIKFPNHSILSEEKGHINNESELTLITIGTTIGSSTTNGGYIEGSFTSFSMPYHTPIYIDGVYQGRFIFQYSI